MTPIDLEIRNLLFERRPALSLPDANDLIREIAICYFENREDSALHEDHRDLDFTTFVCIDGLYLSAIYRKTELLISVFEADDSFIRESERLTMVEVDAHLALMQAKTQGPVTDMRFPMTDAVPWMGAIKNPPNQSSTAHRH